MAIEVTREDLLASIEMYISNGGKEPFEIVAAMNVNLEIDEVCTGSNVRVGKYEFRFTRDRYIPSGELYILDKEHLDFWRQEHIPSIPIERR